MNKKLTSSYHPPDQLSPSLKYNLPSLKALHAVETVGRHGSITSAALELHVTPGAISRHITLLEDYLGCKLFTRHATGLALTEVGRIYVERLSEAFGLINHACSQILRAGERTTLVIRSLGAFSTEWLLTHIAQFENEHPEIEVSIRASLHLVDFETDNADIGIVGDLHKPNGVESIKLYTPHLTPVVSADLLKGKAPINSVEDLGQFKLLHAMKIEPTWEQWTQQVSPNHTLDTTGGYWMERSSQIYQAVRQDVGVGLGQILLLGNDLISGKLVAPLNEVVPAPFSVYLVWPKRKINRPEVQLFQEWLIKTLKATEEKLKKELPLYSQVEPD